MTLTVNAGKLTKLIESFYKLTKIKVAVYDDNFKLIFAYPKKDSAFCEMINRIPEGKCNCKESAKKLCEECRKTKRLAALTCHAGLMDAVAPLYENGIIMGYIMFGQITNVRDKQRFMERAEALCEKYPLNKDEFRRKIKTVPYKDKSQLLAVTEIVNAFTAYIYLQSIIALKKEDTLTLLIDYIDNNLSSDLSAKTLCREFYISKTSLYQLTKSAMPDGIAKYVRSKRMDKAAELIAETEKPIEEIAGMVGFIDCDYFRRLFKQTNGMSANQYRKIHRIQTFK